MTVESGFQEWESPKFGEGGGAERLKALLLGVGRGDSEVNGGRGWCDGFWTN